MLIFFNPCTIFRPRGRYDSIHFGNGTHTQHNNDVMAWKRFPHYRQFVRGIHRPSVDSPPATSGFPTHGQTNLWCFVCRWTNSGVLSRHDAQACEAIVMPFNSMLLGLRNLNSEDQLHQWFCCNSNSIEVPFLFQANSNKVIATKCFIRQLCFPSNRPFVSAGFHPQRASYEGRFFLVWPICRTESQFSSDLRRRDAQVTLLTETKKKHVILTKSSSLATLNSAKMKTFSATSDGNFNEMTFPFQCYNEIWFSFQVHGCVRDNL